MSQYFHTGYLMSYPQIRIDDSSNDRLLPFHQELYGQISKDCLTAWCPLENVNIQNGAIQFIPGTHLSEIEHQFYPEINNYHGISKNYHIDTENIHYAEIKAGDALIFHPLLVHGSTPNKTSKVRYTLVSRFNPIDKIPYLENENEPLFIQQK